LGPAILGWTDIEFQTLTGTTMMASIPIRGRYHVGRAD
jgi:hypothetical protein